jgi:hypothetical protein
VFWWWIQESVMVLRTVLRSRVYQDYYSIPRESISVIQVNQPNRFIILLDLLLVVQIQLDWFQASSCPSSGAYKLQCRWSWSVRPDQPRPTTLLPPHSNGKPEAATAVYKLLMMGKRMLEKCRAGFE